MDKVQQAIGKRIRDARLEAGLKQFEVAEIINMSHSNYQKIEGGHIGVSASLLSQLSKLFKVTADSLLETDNFNRSQDHIAGDVPINYNSEILINKITLLEQMLLDKEEIIRLLKDKLERFGES